MDDQRLHVDLFFGWNVSPDPDADGYSTFIRNASEQPGTLDLIPIFYRSGEIPDPSMPDLVSLAEGEGRNWFGVDAFQSFGGGCDFGQFGTAMFYSPQLAWAQVWYLSNGRDFIVARYTSESLPNPLELVELQYIVLSARFTAD